MPGAPMTSPTRTPDQIRLLLIDSDGAAAHEIQQRLLRDANGGFQVTVASTLEQARSLLNLHEFDVVLASLALTDSPEHETLDRLRFAAPRVPVVVLTASDSAEVALNAVNHGAQDCLIKGRAEGQVIARVLRYAIERARVEDELHRAHVLLEQRVAERTAFLKVTNRRLRDEIAERERTADVLRRERDFSSAILDTVGAIVVVLDREGHIVRCNRCCEETTGYQESELRGRPVWDVFLDPPEKESIRGVFNELLLERIANNSYENVWITRTGARRLIDWSNTSIRDNTGEIEFVIATGIDITERRQAEEMDRRHMLELAHVSRLTTMGQMATEIAHELNQPLAAIASYADTCRRMYDSKTCTPGEVRHMLNEIGSQAERASEVIRRIRKFVRKEDSQHVATELGDLVADVVRLTQVETRWNKVNVVVEIEPGLPRVRVDKILIEQVLLNLVRNAIEAMAEANSQIREVRISTGKRGDGNLELAIQDTGPGFSTETLERMFQSFYTTKPNGMGMGLSLSRSIVAAHGGQLLAETRLPNGATFRVLLPAKLTEGNIDAA